MYFILFSTHIHFQSASKMMGQKHKTKPKGLQLFSAQKRVAFLFKARGAAEFLRRLGPSLLGDLPAGGGQGAWHDAGGGHQGVGGQKRLSRALPGGMTGRSFELNLAHIMMLCQKKIGRSKLKFVESEIS